MNGKRGRGYDFELDYRACTLATVLIGTRVNLLDYTTFYFALILVLRP